MVMKYIALIKNGMWDTKNHKKSYRFCRKIVKCILIASSFNHII